MNFVEDLWLDFRRINITFWFWLFVVMLTAGAIDFVVSSWFFWGDSILSGWHGFRFCSIYWKSCQNLYFVQD